jgi:hypothetical protein
MTSRWLWTQRSDFGPPDRQLGAMAFDASNKCMLLYGGADLSGKTAFTDTWQWDGQSWAQVSNMGPSLPAYAMQYSPSRAQSVLLVGDFPKQNARPCQTWIWDGQEWTQVADIGPTLPVMCAYDLIRDRIVVLTPDPNEHVRIMQTWE